MGLVKAAFAEVKSTSIIVNPSVLGIELEDLAVARDGFVVIAGCFSVLGLLDERPNVLPMQEEEDAGARHRDRSK